MLNYIKSDLYLMGKMKVIYILPIISLLFILMTGFFYIKFNMGIIGVDAQLVDQVEAEAEGKSDSEAFMNSFSAGFSAGMQSEEPEEIEFSDFFSGGLMYHSTAAEFSQFIFAGLITMMLAGIFPAFYFGNWLRGGMTKNILKSNSNRWKPFLSKCIVLLIYCIFICTFVFLASAIAVALFGAEFELGITGAFAGYFLLQVLLTFAFSMMVALVTVAFRSSALAMVFDIICGAGFLNMGLMLIELLINHVIFRDANFEIPLTEYLLTNLSSNLTIGAAGGQIGKTVIAGLIYLAVAIGLGGLIYKKKDIN